MLRNLGDSLSRLGRGAVPGETWHGDYGPHLRGRRQFDRSRRARSKNASKGVLADRLIFQQGIGKRIELCARGAQELAYDLETFGDQVFHLVIDPSGRGVAVLAPLRQLIPEKRLFLIDLERHWPKAPMPHRVIMRLTSRVACTRSFSAPVVMSPSASASDARPPSMTSIRARRSVRL